MRARENKQAARAALYVCAIANAAWCGAGGAYLEVMVDVGVCDGDVVEVPVGVRLGRMGASQQAYGA